jgi:hypothetical protein
MTPSKIILALILAVLIVADFKFPPNVTKFLGSVPGFVVILGLVLYLFVQAPLLGALGVVAAFMVLNQASPANVLWGAPPSRIPDPLPSESTPSFGITLEEIMVRNILPLVNNSPNAVYANSFGSTHNAASV